MIGSLTAGGKKGLKTSGRVRKKKRKNPTKFRKREGGTKAPPRGGGDRNNDPSLKKGERAARDPIFPGVPLQEKNSLRRPLARSLQKIKLEPPKRILSEREGSSKEGTLKGGSSREDRRSKRKVAGTGTAGGGEGGFFEEKKGREPPGERTKKTAPTKANTLQNTRGPYERGTKGERIS